MTYSDSDNVDRAGHLFEGGDRTAQISISEESIVRAPLQLQDGFLIVPDAPGIGVELAEGVEKRYPYRPRPIRTRLQKDGSVMDQ